MARKNRKRYHNDLKDRCAFLEIEFPGDFPSTEDMASALRRKMGTMTFSQYIEAQELREQWKHFRKKRRNQIKDEVKVENASHGCKTKVNFSRDGFDAFVI